MEKISQENQAKSLVATYEDHENKCKNCGGFKFRSYDRQLKSVDELVSKFVVCAECGCIVLYCVKK